MVRYPRNRPSRGYRKKRNFFGSLSTNFLLIVITSIISIIAFILFALSEKYINYLALTSSNILQGKYLWTLVSHMFVHGGFGHLFVNMFVLFSLGGLCERIIGKKRYVWFYLIAGVFAGVLSVLLTGFFGMGLGERIFGSADMPMVGASGAIFAIAGLLMMLLPRLKFSIIFLPFFALPAYLMIPLVLFLTWGLSVIFAWPIGNVAHFGGFLAGVIYGLYLRVKYNKKVQMLQRYFR